MSIFIRAVYRFLKHLGFHRPGSAATIPKHRPNPADIVLSDDAKIPLIPGYNQGCCRYIESTSIKWAPWRTGLYSEVVLMQTTVLILRFGDKLGKQETGLNERIAEKEKEGWEVVDMQITPPAFGSQPAIILRLTRESN